MARCASGELRSLQTLSLFQIPPQTTLLSLQHPELPRTSWQSWGQSGLGGCWGLTSFYRS